MLRFVPIMLRLKICVQMQLKRIKYIPDRYWTNKCRSSHPEVFLLIVVLKIRSKFTGWHLWWSAISIKLQSNFIEIRTSASVFSCNLVHIFITAFLQNTSGRLLLEMCHKVILENGRILGLISDSYKDQKCAIKLLIIILML